MPVIVTVNVPSVEPVQFRVEVPDPVTLVGVRVQVTSTGDTIGVRDTTPLNPFAAVTVAVEEAAPLCEKLMLLGLALMVKSRTVMVTVVV